MDYRGEANGFEGAHGWRSEIGRKVRPPLSRRL